MYAQKFVTYVIYERVLQDDGRIKDITLGTKYDEVEANILLNDAKALKPKSIIRMRRDVDIEYV